MHFDRITHNPDVHAGKPCVRGSRITVTHVLSLVANGMTFQQIIEEYVDLEIEDVRQAVQYGAWLANHEHRPLTAP